MEAINKASSPKEKFRLNLRSLIITIGISLQQEEEKKLLFFQKDIDSNLLFFSKA